MDLIAAFFLHTMKDDIPCFFPKREKNEPLLPETILFFLAPQEKKTVEQSGVLGNGRRHFLFHSNLWTVAATETHHGFALAGPAVGAPMAVLTLEKLIALGGRKIIVHGWCGALDQGYDIGDVFLPSRGISEEGVTPLYPAGDLPEADGPLRHDLAQYLASGNIRFHSGACWSTDAPYMETGKKVRAFAALGAGAVDMEFSALATVARFRGVSLAAAFTVSDLFTEKGRVTGYSMKKFKSKKEELFSALINYCRQDSHGRH